MDPKYIALMAVASSAALAVIVWAISDAVVRYAEVRQRRDAGLNGDEISERLSRIESAIDAMSVEVERIGELQRFNAQLRVARPSAEPQVAERAGLLPTQTGRVITPH